MIEIIKQHLEFYPKMELQDVAKLLYQSEFGGGHLIADSERSLKRIQEECETMDIAKMSYISEIEPIGDGMCRVYLPVLFRGMKAEVLNELFVQSANRKKGSVEGLEEKINAFKKVCAQGMFHFEKQAVDDFFETWKDAGYPMQSHTAIYREAYYPAYRVMELSAVKVWDVIEVIEKADKPFIVAIDGMSASGKSTLGELLKKNYPEANLFHMDDYFLQPHQRTEERMAEAGGNVDYERMEAEIVSKLSDKEGLSYRPYNCQTQSLEEAVFVEWKPLVFVEGCYSQHPYLGDYYDFGVFCEISPEEQIERIRKRNGEFMLKRFAEEWIPRENQYFEKYMIKEKSGLQ